MKRLPIFFIAFVFCLNIAGQRPETFYYQALIRDQMGNPVISKPVSFRLSILAGNVSGLVIYSETQSAVTDEDGLVSLAIGNGSNKIGTLASIDWNSEKYFLKVEDDPANGTDYNELYTTQVLNVPFEFQKKSIKRSSEVVIEDEFLMTRKYVGQFVDYRHTGPDTYNGPNIIWIKTTLDRTFGKFSAYGRTCDFQKGDNLYIRRVFYSPAEVTGYWVYQIENDSTVYYRLSEFQYDKKVYVETMFK